MIKISKNCTTSNFVYSQCVYNACSLKSEKKNDNERVVKELNGGQHILEW